MNTRFKDFLAAAYILLLAALIWFNMDWFISITKAHPYEMGFFKVGLLATFGEMLKGRIITGNWQAVNHLFSRFVVWGFFGVWFAYAFPLFRLGTEAVISVGLWPYFNTGHWFDVVWVAFSKSLAINFLGGYAFTMMVTHEHLNTCIEERRIVSFKFFSKRVDNHFWFVFIPKTIFLFWLWAHTFTFLLPPHWQVLVAAGLSVVLGVLITVGKKLKA